MFAGDPLLRAKKTGSMTIYHRCLAKGDRMSGGSGAPCSNTDTANFPSKPCPVLKLQSTDLLQGCTKAQQAKEDVGDGTCMHGLFIAIFYCWHVH
jgi:hypothetical protein